MTQRQLTGVRGGPLDPATVATLAERVGLVLVVVTLPVAIGTFAGMAVEAASLLLAVDAAASAMNGPLTIGQGLSWLFHVSTLGTALGCWVLGLGLVLDGLDV